MTTGTIEVDLELVERLIARETAALDRKHARSLRYREEAKAHLPGGVSSSWQLWPPHPIYVRRGAGSHVWDIDENEYVDYHNGYGVMVMGHAHPKIVEAVQRRVALGTHFAQPTEDALIVAEQLAERTGLPYWRFGNSGTEATMDAVRIMRATTGRDLIVKIEGSYHGHHDALMVSVFPSPEAAGPRERPRSVPQTPGLQPGAADFVLVVPFNDATAAERAVRRTWRRDRRDDRGTRHDELRCRAAGHGIPRAAEGDLPRARRDVRLRRGEDGLHGGVGRRDRGFRRAAGPGGVRQGAGRRAALRGDRREPRTRWG